VFNLSWSPEDFKEVQVSTEELVDAGERGTKEHVHHAGFETQRCILI
jgi:hypothetical protein